MSGSAVGLVEFVFKNAFGIEEAFFGEKSGGLGVSLVKLLEGGMGAVGQIIAASTGMGNVNELTGKREHGSFSFFVTFLMKEKHEAEHFLGSVTKESVVIRKDVPNGDVEEFGLVFEKNRA